MEVSKINNYNSRSATPNFKSKGLDPKIVEQLGKDSGKVAKFLTYVGENQGEVLNILVTAVGTAVVCPAFIAFNPFSKEDKETKVYSAWRQPISAVIALATQLTITKWFNDFMAKKASTQNKEGNSAFARADLRTCPHERYLKKIIKLEHPEFNKSQIEEEVKKRQLTAEKVEIAKLRRAYAGKEVKIEDLLCQEYLDKAKSQLLEDLKTQHKEEIEKNFGKNIDDIWKSKLNNHLQQLLDNKAAAENKTKDQLIKETAEAMIEKEVTAEAVIKTIIRHLKSKGENVSETINKCTPECIEDVIHELHLEPKFENGLNSKDVAEEIVNRLNIVKEYETQHQLKDFTSVKNMGTTFEDVLHNVKVKKLVRSKTSDAKKVFKTMNTQMGLIVTLATLPLTCGFLNWSYPRIMEKIMPEIVAKKKGQPEKTEKDNHKIDKIVDNMDLDDIDEIKNIDSDKLKARLKQAIKEEEDD